MPSWARIIEAPLRLGASYSDLNKRFPASESAKSLYEDTNAQKLARVLKPDVIIGIKALQCIFASQLTGDGDDWIIPLQVAKIDEKLVFFIEEPLMKCSAYNILEKYKIFAEAATKQLLLKPWDYVPRAKPNTSFEKVRFDSEILPEGS